MVNPKKLWAAKVLDLLISFYFLISRRKPRLISNPTSDMAVASILIFESHLLGDTVMVQPLIAALKVRFPNAAIVLLGNPWARAVFDSNESLSTIETLNVPWIQTRGRIQAWLELFSIVKHLRTKRFDLAIDTRGDIRNILLLWLIGSKYLLSNNTSGGAKLLTHIAPAPRQQLSLLREKFSILSPLGIKDQGATPVLGASPEAIEWAKGAFPLVGKMAAAVHPGASQASRKMGLGQAAAIIQGLQLAGYSVFLVGSQDEVEFCTQIASKVPGGVDIVAAPLDKFKGFLVNVSLFIGTDSGPCHLASALGCTTVALVESQKFGITPPETKTCIQVKPEGGQTRISDISPIVVLASIAGRG